jgi:hypothetical protein
MTQLPARRREEQNRNACRFFSPTTPVHCRLTCRFLPTLTSSPTDHRSKVFEASELVKPVRLPRAETEPFV